MVENEEVNCLVVGDWRQGLGKHSADWLAAQEKQKEQGFLLHGDVVEALKMVDLLDSYEFFVMQVGADLDSSPPCCNEEPEEEEPKPKRGRPPKVKVE